MTKQLVEIYYKEDCHLCERLEIELESFVMANALQDKIILQRKDIEDHAQWYDLYREYVPVVVIDDEEVCHYFFDLESMRDALKGVLKGEIE